MGISAKEAAEAVGLSRNGIIKAIKNGRISGVKNKDGEWEIEPSELFRVYDPVVSVEGGKIGESGIQSTYKDTVVQTLQIELLRQKIGELERRMEDKTEVIEDLRKRLDRAAEEQAKLTALLTDERKKPEIKPVERKLRWLWWGGS